MIFQLIGGMSGLYKVVPPNEAHVRVMGSKKDIFSHRGNSRSAYWIVPFITKVNRLPLCNLTIPVNDIKLNDKNMAKFVCDIVCFVNIKDLELASERLFLSDAEKQMGFDFVKLSEDFRAIMESIGRTVVTKQTILDIYMNRQALSVAITTEIEAVFPKWGIELVNLELKHIKDYQDSTIIFDIERKVASEIKRDADIKISDTNKQAQMAIANNEEEYRKRQIQKEQEIGIAEQTKNQQVALAQAEANSKLIDAKRKLEVGQAEIEKQKVQLQSEAQKIKFTVEAEGQAKQITSVGQAHADVVEMTATAEASKIESIGNASASIIQKTKEAEAAGTEKLAVAMAKFNDAAKEIKVIDVQKEIMIEKFRALGNALSKADIKLILSGEKSGSLFGLDFNAQTGANLEQFLKESGLTLEGIKALIDKK